MKAVCSSSMLSVRFHFSSMLFVESSFFLMSVSESEHAFENRWVLLEQCYIDNRADRSKGYENSFDKLCTIDTVESFWNLLKCHQPIA